jgi:monoamine oxidase
METDVVIIGAGISGLAAAHRLAGAGWRVLVLEARARAGGRILTHYPRGSWHPVELGAEFVHGGDAFLRAALRRAGLRLKPVRKDMWIHDDGGLRRLHAYWREIGRLTAHIPAHRRISFDTFLRGQKNLPRTERTRLRLFVEGFNAAPAEKFSASSMRGDQGQVDGIQSRPDRGYQPLVDDLVRRLQREGARLRLRSPVSAVRWRGGNVEATVRGRIHQARAAIITLPLGVWRDGTIRFTPRLKAKERIVRRLGWGHVVRMILRFDRRSWRTQVLPAELLRRHRADFGFLSSMQAEVPTWWVPDPSEPILVGWCGGPKAERLLRRGRAAWVASALRSLARITGKPPASLRTALRDWWMHDWSADRHSRGAYSYSVAGFENGPKMLARPLSETLFFAGEATSEALGTVHGALSSGIRAADTIGRVLTAKR